MSLLKLCSLFADTYGVKRLSANPLQSDLKINKQGMAKTIKEYGFGGKFRYDSEAVCVSQRSRRGRSPAKLTIDHDLLKRFDVINVKTINFIIFIIV